MPMPDGPQFNMPLTPQELVKPANVFATYKTPRDLEWSMPEGGEGISAQEKWNRGLTDRSVKGNRGYLNIPGPTLRGQNG